MDDNEGIDFIPEANDEDVNLGQFAVEFKLAETAADFKGKAKSVLSNALDLLNAKLTSGFAEASDIKTAVEIGKMFQIGVETVDEAAERVLAETEDYEEVDEEADTDDSMRFQG